MNLDDTLLREYWHLLCHRKELPHDGDFLRFDTAIGDIVVFNDSGDIIAYDNRCPHRGALMFAGSAGQQGATCKYHGWTYKNGRMIVPHPEQFKGCDLAQAQLNKYQIDWCGDFAFVAVAPRRPLHEQLGDTAATLENIAFNIAGRADLNTGVFDCYWPVAVENALEPYHIGMVHPDTLGALQLEAGVNSYHGENSIWRAPVGNARVARQLQSLKRYFAIDYAYEGYMSVYLFPFTMISSTYGLSYSLQNFFPAADRRSTSFTSRLLTTHLASGAAQQIIAPLFASTAAVNRKVFDEDHAVCKLVPADSWSSAPLRFASVTEEKIEHFRASVRAVEKQGGLAPRA
jgi:phenylpropionate dioxygenase-like ring-hydroxylating dioxygenase large terminal subunit